MQASIFLKAGSFEEPEEERGRAQTKPRGRTLLLPLEGRSGFAFALWVEQPKLGWTESLNTVLTDHLTRLSASFGIEANPQHRFEQFLSALNEQLAGHVREGAWRMPISAFHALVGIACDDRMFLSGAGDLTSLFLHRKPGNRYQIFNLFRSIQTEQALPTWEKAFAVVLDGDLHFGDVLCISNKDLPRVIQPDDLHGSLATLPPGGAAERLRQFFPSKTDLALLVIQVQGTEPTPQTAQPLTRVSVDHLGKTEEETTRLLEDQRPGFIRAVQQWFRRFKKPASRVTSQPRWWRAVYGIFAFVWRALKTVGLALFWIGRVSVRTEQRREAWRKTKGRIDTSARAGLNRFNRLPPTSKYLLLAAVAVFFFLGIGILTLGRTEVKRAETRAYQNHVEEVEAKRDQAAGAIIYKDEKRARQLYTEALERLEELPANTSERQTQKDELRSEISAALDQLRHLVTIQDPPVYGSLPEGVQGVALTKSGPNIVVLSSEKGWYRLDPSKQLTKIAAADGMVGVAKEAVADETQIFFLDNRPGLSRIETASNLAQITDLKPEAGQSWMDLTLYANRLYVLDQNGGDGRVLRFSPTSSGWSAPVSWIKSKTTSLDDAVSLAIDATVFVLKKDGVLVRFGSGSEISWSQELVDPPIQNATDVWTDADSAYVYVLESAGKRILVYRKDNGTLVNQYRSDVFTDPSDLLVDEPSKTIYLLSGRTLYGIRASHL